MQVLTDVLKKVSHLDPRVSEFDSLDQSQAYSQWLNKEVQSRRNDGAISVPNSAVMQRLSALLSKYPQS